VFLVVFCRPCTIHCTGPVSRTGEEMQSKDDEATWVRGGKEDDNQRYRDFLKYFEEKRGKEDWR
jgi:hypothetical protein